jgi:hypothetical protein
MNNEIEIEIYKFFQNPNEYVDQINKFSDLINHVNYENSNLKNQLSPSQLTELNLLLPEINIQYSDKSDIYNSLLDIVTNNKKKKELTKTQQIIYLILRYLIMLLLLNRINKNEFDDLSKTIKKIDPTIIIPTPVTTPVIPPVTPPPVTPPVTPPPVTPIPVIDYEYEIFKEESSTNFGHENVVIKGDVTFDQPIDTTNLIYNRNYSGSYKNRNYSGSYKTGGSSSSAIVESENVYIDLPDYINKQEKLKTVEFSDSENILKNIFELRRYYLKKKEEHEIQNPNASNGPTFSLSLFMQNDKIHQKDYAEWTIKYYSNQIRLILIYKYFFPKCNIRLYFDYYMLEKGFATLSGDNESLILTKQISRFTYTDFEEEKEESVRVYLNICFAELKKYENTKFKTGLERFLFYYYICSKVIISNGNVSFDYHSVIDFFVYKFSGPFIENKGLENEGHITNGYIGQQIRYIALRQQNYYYNETLINRPIHLVWRDAHANCPAYNDYLYIKQMNDIAINKSTEVYLIPTSIDYMVKWHDLVKCTINGKYLFRSAIAGIVQFVNSKDDKKFITDDVYYRSVGVTFLLDNNNNLPILKHRHMGFNKGQKEYGYGIDEYINSAFFNINEIKNKSIYFHHYWVDNIFRYKKDEEDENKIKNNLFLVIEFLLLIYLINNGNFVNTGIASKFKFLKEIEKLRNNEKLKNNAVLRLLLSIYPTKYHFNLGIFTTENFGIVNDGENGNFDLTFNIETARENFNSYLSKTGNQELANSILNENNKVITMSDLNKLKITCYSSAISSSMEWCVNPYLDKQRENEINCPPADFYSGFYFDNPPSLGIGIIRQPSDIPSALENLITNTLLIPLNKSNYKLQVESNEFTKAIEKNIVNGEINPKLLYLILWFNDEPLYFKEIYEWDKDNLVLIDNKMYYSKLFSPFIFKALNYAGYDVDPKYINVHFDDDNKNRIFNENVIGMANMSEWAKYTAYLLTTKIDYSTFKFNDNKKNKDLMSKDLTNIFVLQKKFKEDFYNNKDSMDHSMYKMKKMAGGMIGGKNYIKYLKYKNKYLELKKKSKK